MSAAEVRSESDVLTGGAPPRHIDYTTAQLDRLARSWIDVQQTRKALAQRQLDDSIVEAFAEAEQKISRALSKTLRSHPLWPWLSQFPGLGGAHTALIIGRIGDPRRYPGQRCTEGHYLPPIYIVGATCPIAEIAHEVGITSGDGASSWVGSPDARADDLQDESDRTSVCPGVMLPPRTTTGVRSLWHWAGLHADHEGRAPRKRKGVKADWEPRVRASAMQPGGLADQIVRLGVRIDPIAGERIALHVYAQIYLDTKARLILRVPDDLVESDWARGDAKPSEWPEQMARLEHADALRPLKLYEADRIARKVAAKAFLGDLLIEWKRLTDEMWNRPIGDGIAWPPDAAGYACASDHVRGGISKSNGSTATPRESVAEPSTERNLP